MTNIKDGTGSGYLVRVDSKNRLHTLCITIEEETYINLNTQQMYTMSISNITPAVANNCIGYIKNTDNQRTMIVTRIRMRCETTATTLVVRLNATGTPGATTDATPVNRNTGSGNEADGEFYYGTGITGLTGGDIVGSIYAPAAQPFEDIDPCSGYVLTNGGVLTLYGNQNTGAIWVGVGFYFIDNDIID